MWTSYTTVTDIALNARLEPEGLQILPTWQEYFDFPKEKTLGTCARLYGTLKTSIFE